MDPELWRRVDEVFQRARGAEPGARRPLLESACGGDRRLREEVESLLQAYDQASSFLEIPALQTVEDRDRDSWSGSWIGRRLGAYVILREIGRGGMSVVFLAARADEQYERLVALKLISPRLGEEVVRRFVQERQILAALDHPNIARLYDGGATEDGIPYLVMELVEGAPIDLYCDRERLSIRERLRLFQQVCGAVQHAHGRLVVHRDLKPSNILVTSDRTPKLLDFGIAKLLEPGAVPGAQGLQTALFRPMTPTYASPEQMRGEPITTASDVYSLGVLLYELLAGGPPHRPSGAEGSRAAVERPSRALGSAGEIARRRRTDPARLRRRLSGDLDNIVLKALRWETEERYASVEGLADDLRRHLSGLPVRASRGTFLYRAGKFLRRNRLAVGLAAALFLLAVTSALVTAFLAMRANEQRAAAGAAQRRAERVLDFVVRTFESPDPDRFPRRAQTVPEMLRQSAARAARELEDDPVVQSDVLLAIGRVLDSLGDYGPAEEALRTALGLRRRLYPPDHPALAESLTRLARVEKDRHQLADAIELQREAVKILRGLPTPDGPRLAEALGTLAGLRRLAGDLPEAEDLYREVLALWRQEGEDGASRLAGTLNELALLGHEEGDLEQAEELHREALEIERRILGEDHPTVGMMMNNLSVVVAERGSLEEAEGLLRGALEILRSSLGENHPRVAGSLNKLASVLRDRGDYPAAEPLFQEALAIRHRVFGESHPAVAVSLAGLADLYRRQGDFPRSERHYRESLSIARASMPPGYPGMAHPLLGLAEVLAIQGRHRGAEPLVREALEIRRKALPEDSPLILKTELKLADCLLSLGRYEESEALLLARYAALESGEADRGAARALLEGMIRLYDAWSRPEESAVYRRRLARLDAAAATEDDTRAL